MVGFEAFLFTMTVDPSSTEFSFAMLSSVGRVRTGNEDFCAARPERGLFIVCDGMGGAAAGEVASQLAASTFLRHMETALPLPETAEALLHGAVRAANDAVFAQSQARVGQRGMGTTLIALLLEPAGEAGEGNERKLWLAHVGDSRCYRMRAGALTQMSEDHSFVQEQVRAGQLTEAQAERSPMRNIITRAIGSAAKVEPAVQALGPEAGDVYLLASDGLTRELSDERLAGMLAEAASGELETVCAGLIEAANAAGGHDNVTVLLLRIEARP